MSKKKMRKSGKEVFDKVFGCVPAWLGLGRLHLGGDQLERVLHRVVEPRQKVFQSAEARGDGRVLRRRLRSGLQQLPQQKHVARHVLHRGQQQRAQVQASARRSLKARLKSNKKNLVILNFPC
jgi:hypothetical protein